MSSQGHILDRSEVEVNNTVSPCKESNIYFYPVKNVTIYCTECSIS